MSANESTELTAVAQQGNDAASAAPQRLAQDYELHTESRALAALTHAVTAPAAVAPTHQGSTSPEADQVLDDGELEELQAERFCSTASLSDRLVACLQPGGWLASVPAGELLPARGRSAMEHLQELADAALADKFAAKQSRRRRRG